MAEPERFLLALQCIDARKVVLEFDTEHYLAGKLEAAKNMKVWVRRVSAEELDSEEYQGLRPYDMGHEVTSRIFHLEQWMHYLLYEGEKPHRKV
jgi:hypothetical protein